MNHAIVQIGGNFFLCPSIPVAAKVVELLGKCVQVDQDFVNEGDALGHRYVYGPRDPGSERLCPVELKIVEGSAIRKPIARVPKQRRLGFTPPIDPA